MIGIVVVMKDDRNLFLMSLSIPIKSLCSLGSYREIETLHLFIPVRAVHLLAVHDHLGKRPLQYPVLQK